ncbi:MAG: cytochrome c biogenesis protein [Cyanobacteria bacterium P01_C01_bin.89]
MDANDASSQSFPEQLRQQFKLVRRVWRRDIVPAIADLRLAIVLLLAIAAFSILGTVIEQGQTLNYYQTNYPEDPALFGFLSWKVILIIGLDHVYRTWWFLGLLVVFGASLTACSFLRQLPALKSARRWRFYTRTEQFEKLALSARLNLFLNSTSDGKSNLDGDVNSGVDNDLGSNGLDSNDLESHKNSAHSEASTLNFIQEYLGKKSYKVFQKGDSIYARKGIVGRIGPIVVHISMLLVLLGAIVGALGGYFAQEIGPSGGVIKIQHLLDAGPFGVARVPKDWYLKVNRFWIDYTPGGDIDQFYSDLSVMGTDGQEKDRQTIYVNKPLRYKGTTIYQTNWSIAAVKVHLNNSPVFELPMAPLKGMSDRLWGTWVPTKPDLSEGVSLVTRDLQGTMLIYDMKGDPIATTRVGRSVKVNGINLVVDDLVGSTGLQIKTDPGIPLVYLGFGLLMVGTLMSYVSHSQVWILATKQGLYVGGKTNRAQVSFEREMLTAIADFQALAPEREIPSTPESPVTI